MKFGLAAFFGTCIEAYCTAGSIHELGDNKLNRTKNLYGRIKSNYILFLNMVPLVQLSAWMTYAWC